MSISIDAGKVTDNGNLEVYEWANVGPYAVFDVLKWIVGHMLEHGHPGTRFPHLMNRPSTALEYAPEEAQQLCAELSVIRQELSQICFDEVNWSNYPRIEQVTQQLDRKADNLSRALLTVDDEPLLEALQRVCQATLEHQASIFVG